MNPGVYSMLFSIIFSSFMALNKPPQNQAKTLAKIQYSLENRYKNAYVNRVFADNILLTLAYMSGKIKKANKIEWDRIREKSSYKMSLKPGETFAFHSEILQKYQNKVIATTNAHFSSNEGFLSDGYLVGDGVCHLASFMKVAAQSSGLLVEAPTRHDFASIPDVPKENGVSIYYTPKNPLSSQLQNLYITNTRKKTVAFVFTHEENSLDIQVQEL